jgi:hypothetical protein
MTEFTIHLANRPGQLAGLAKAFADAGVNIEALAAFGMGEMGLVRLLVADAAQARNVIREGALVAEEREVLRTVLPNEPGALARLTQSLAGAGINIDGIYVLRTTNGGVELAVAVDDPEQAAFAIS